jgi:hypothetical protein
VLNLPAQAARVASHLTRPRGPKGFSA